MEPEKLLSDPHYILLFLSGLVVLSYIFDLFSHFLRLPSVLMLIAAGIGLQLLMQYFHIGAPPSGNYLEILGTIGLILIVLEGALDLKLSRDRLPMILGSLGTAFFSLIITTGILSFILHEFMDIPYHQAIINAIPFSVISSSIAIPSVVHLHQDKKDFIVYESTFSDILGIMLFNFMVTENHFGWQSVANFGISIVSIAVISVISCLILLFFIERINMHIKFFLVFAVLILVYTMGKMLNLSALLLVLVFGMAIRNSDRVLIGKLRNFFNTDKLDSELQQLKLVTAESAFLIRTFFFILFGFSFHLRAILNPVVWAVGGFIVVVLLIVRVVSLKFFARSSILPELFVAPRGLVTILLFYGIPESYKIMGFNGGVLFFVIIVTSLLMMLGLLFSPGAEAKPKPADTEPQQ